MLDFERAVDMVLELEGGYVDHPNDPGGETNYGISKRSYPHLDIANLTRGEAKAIYRRDFWEPIAERVVDPRLRLLAFDSAVNHGLGRALGWLDEFDTFEAFLGHRIEFYVSLNAWQTFGRGWMRRVAHVIRASESQRNRSRVDLLVDNRSVWVRLTAAILGTSEDVVYQVRPQAGPDGGWKMDVDDA